MLTISKKPDIKKMLQQLWQHFCNDSLFRNSIYLMLSTAVQAFFGFIFWLLVARLYTPAEVGFGSTLISAVVFISYISLLGLNNTLIKFLPTSKQRSEKINSSLVLVFSAAFFVSLVYILILPHIAPRLSFVAENIYFSSAFILLSSFCAINLLTDSVFIAYRASKYNFLIYTIQSIAKLILPLVLVTFGSFGVFASSGLAATIALILSIFYLTKKFNYKPKISVSKNLLKDLWKFSSANYLSDFFNITPIIIIPIIIMNKLGAPQAGYYYLAFMLANLLYAVAYSVSQSLFAEGSHGEKSLRSLFKHSALILAAIMIPAGLILSLLGPFLLHIFGKSYGEEAGKVITILALAAPAVAAYILSIILLRITNKLNTLIGVNAIYVLTICGLAYVWASRGLVWVALAWLIGHLITASISFLLIFFSSRKKILPTNF